MWKLTSMMFQQFLDSDIWTSCCATSADIVLLLGRPSVKKVTKLRTFSVPPLAPPPSLHLRTLMGVFFLKARTDDSRHLAKKAGMLPFLGEPIPFIRNSKMLVLSKHFWGVNSDFCANFINQNSFCDIRENIPKSYASK